MKICHQQNLKYFNTFGVEAKAKLFAEVYSIDQLIEILKKFSNEKHLFLGGGSNILFTKDFDGIVLLNRITGNKIIHQTHDDVLIEVYGGENWNAFVQYTLNKGWGGLENLSLIPGTVGAAPIQNIGAYGVELKDIIASVKALDITTFSLRELPTNACAFGYRDSMFKRNTGRYFIYSVTFKLSKSNHRLNTSYVEIQSILERKGIKDPTPRDISNIVIEIRSNKLPEPSQLANAGSFFKNPVVSYEKFEGLKSKYPNIRYFEQTDGVKLSAAWLIDQCGWKGYREPNGAGVHHLQPLVLVNFGNATGRDIVKLSEKIQESVYEKFGVKLYPEVNIL